jgi:hypothetical protein
MKTDEICQKFLKDKTKNPVTGRNISPTGAVYNKLVKECESRAPQATKSADVAFYQVEEAKAILDSQYNALVKRVGFEGFKELVGDNTEAKNMLKLFDGNAKMATRVLVQRNKGKYMTFAYGPENIRVSLLPEVIQLKLSMNPENNDYCVNDEDPKQWGQFVGPKRVLSYNGNIMYALLKKK